MVHENQTYTSELAKIESDRVEAQECAHMLNSKAQESIEKLTTEIETLRSMVPSDAEKLDLEQKANVQCEAKWRTKIEDMIEDLEASKLSVHNLLKDNLYLRTTLKAVTVEGERSLDECKLAFQKKLMQLESMNQELRAFHDPKVERLMGEIQRLSQENLKCKSKIKVRMEKWRKTSDCQLFGHSRL